MTLDEAIKTIKYERDELHKKQLAGHHTWATGVLAAAIELLPYAVEHQEWRYKFAGLAMQGILANPDINFRAVDFLPNRSLLR